MTNNKSAGKAEVITSPKWVRVFLNDQAVADSKNPLLLRGLGQIPVYYFPRQDVRMEWLQPAPAGSQVSKQGEGPWPDPPEGAKIYTIQVGEKTADNAAWHVEMTPTDYPRLADHVAFAWQAMDAWYEEDEPILFHPHDPYHLIDVRASSRHVRVLVHGELVAETNRPVLLFEPGLPVRYYIPRMDVQMALVEPSSKTTHCAYKGTAPHFSVRVGDELVEDIAWHYPFPNLQYALIQNLICFYQERTVDLSMDVDGKRQLTS
jgi:uncharacterized protein (DUF427 family)